MNKAKKFFDRHIKQIAGRGIVYDIGGCSGFQKSLTDYRQFFKDCAYKTIDINPKCEPDILADAQSLPIADNSADGAIINSVLEYIESPQKAIDEIYRILKPEGICFCSTTFLHPYHGSSANKDYWRFSSDGLRLLFRKFSSIEICPIKGYFETMANFLPWQNKFPMRLALPTARFFDRVFAEWQNSRQSSGFFVFLVK